MRAGSLKHKIIIEKPTTSTDGYGAVENNYEEFKTVFASVEQFTSKEYFFSNQIVEVCSKKFRVRFFSGLEMDMRINFNGEYFDIKDFVNPYERNRELIIAASKISNG